MTNEYLMMKLLRQTGVWFTSMLLLWLNVAKVKMKFVRFERLIVCSWL